MSVATNLPVTAPSLGTAYFLIQGGTMSSPRQGRDGLFPEGQSAAKDPGPDSGRRPFRLHDRAGAFLAALTGKVRPAAIARGD